MRCPDHLAQTIARRDALKGFITVLLSRVREFLSKVDRRYASEVALLSLVILVGGMLIVRLAI